MATVGAIGMFYMYLLGPLVTISRLAARRKAIISPLSFHVGKSKLDGYRCYCQVTCVMVRKAAAFGHLNP